MTGIAAFTNRPECRMCGHDRFTWRYSEETHSGDAVLKGPHLHLVCDRCGWEFNMKAKDDER